MRVRLNRKLADLIDEVDLSRHEVGDVIELPSRQGHILIAEGWAVAERRSNGPIRVLAFRRATDLGHHTDEDDVSRAS
jgi:hypothetical protein